MNSEKMIICTNYELQITYLAFTVNFVIEKSILVLCNL